VFSCGFRGVLAAREGADRGTVRTETPLNSMMVSQTAYLVMVWCCHKDDWAISGDVEGAPGTYLSEEDTCDGAPEDEGGLVGKVG